MNALFLCLIGLTITVSGYRRYHSNIPQQIKQMKDLLHESVKFINEETGETEGGTLKIRIASNNFCLYMEEATSSMHRALEIIQDTTSKQESNQFTIAGKESTYNLEKDINVPNVKKLKSALKRTLLGYVPVLEKGVEFFGKADISLEPVRRIVTAAREAFDMALFNFVFINTQLKYHNESNPVINGAITTTLEQVYGVLANITTDDKQVTGELSVYSHHLCRLMDILLVRMERWTYIYKDETKIKLIYDVVQNVTNNVIDLRLATRSQTTSPALAKNETQFFQESFETFNRLTSVDDGEADKQQIDIFKNILIQALAIIRTFGRNLELLKLKSN